MKKVPVITKNVINNKKKPLEKVKGGLPKVPSSFLKVYPDFLTAELKRNWHIYRFDPKLSGYSDRYYYKYNPDKRTCKAYLSLTSAVDKLVPKGPGFYAWLKKVGQRSEFIASSTASFGTTYHQISLEPLIYKTGYDFDWLTKKSDKNPSFTNFNTMFDREFWMESGRWYRSFTRGIMSFWEFAKARIIKLYAVELPLCSDKYNYAGTLDLVIVIKFRGKEYLAIVDLKSKLYALFDKEVTKKFYDAHFFQLEMQKKLLIENYPSLVKKHGGPDNIMLFNFAPNNWKGKKTEEGDIVTGETYTLANHTKTKYNEYVYTLKGERSKTEKLIDAKLKELPFCEFAKPPSSDVDVTGSFDSIDMFNITDHLEIIDIL